MSSPRKLAGTTHHDPMSQKAIEAAKLREVERVKRALEDPDQRREMLSRYETGRRL